MALTPDSQSDPFLREVDENYRRDRMESFARTYGKWIALAVVVFLALVGAYIYWQHRQSEQSARETEELHKIFGDVGQDKTGTVPQRIAALEGSNSDAVRSLALLTDAAVALEANDRAKAIAKYRELSGDKGMPEPFRNIATIRLTAAEFDTIKPQEVIRRLEPLAQAGSPWFGSASEMIALAYLKLNQPDKAGQIFAQIAADTQAPQSLRSRAVQIAGTLGVDASDAIPALQNQGQNQE